MPLTFQSLGGALEIGASCHAISDGSRTLLLDAGLHPKREREAALPDLNALAGPSPTALVVSHCHHDHVGALPVVLERFPSLRAYLTPASRAIAAPMLRNAASLMARQVAADPDPTAAPLFDRDTLDRIAPRVLAMDTDEPFTLQGKPPRGDATPVTRLLSSGHVLGAVGVDIVWDDHRIFYTGDLSLRSQGLLGGADLPPRCDTLIMESTLGMSPELDTWTRDAEMARFASHCRAVLARGGSVIAPCFALGRTQEMLRIVHELRLDGSLPPTVPVYVGGLGRAINEIYDAFRWSDARLHRSFLLDDVPHHVLSPAAAADPLLLETPSIFLVTSGMLNEHTGAALLARAALDDERHGLFFTGYVDHEAAGYPLYRAATGDYVTWWGHPEGVTVRAELQRFRFSAHALRCDLIQVAEALRPSRVLLVHGSPGASESLAASLRERLPGAQVDVVWPRRTYALTP